MPLRSARKARAAGHRRSGWLAWLLAALAVQACRSRSVEPPPAGEDAGPSSARAVTGMGTAPAPVGEGWSGEARGQEAVAICPVDGQDPDAVLDEASRLLYDAGGFETALACADLAADLVPQAVEAHHYRAAALAALGRYGDA